MSNENNQPEVHIAGLNEKKGEKKEDEEEEPFLEERDGGFKKKKDESKAILKRLFITILFGLLILAFLIFNMIVYEFSLILIEYAGMPPAVTHFFNVVTTIVETIIIIGFFIYLLFKVYKKKMSIKNLDKMFEDV